MTYGPIQLQVIAFDRADLPRDLIEEIRKVREDGTIRLISATFVAKDEDGRIKLLEHSDLSEDEAAELGRLTGTLFGFGYAGEAGAVLGADIGQLAAEAGDFGLTRGDVEDIAAQIPRGASALILLFEHRWAIGVRQAIRDAGGRILSSGFVTAEMLVAAGAALAEEEDAAEAANGSAPAR